MRLVGVFIRDNTVDRFLFLFMAQINWTVLYRRKHRKGMVEEAAKKRTRRTQKFMRAVTGATLADIMAKRNQKPEVRKAQRSVTRRRKDGGTGRGILEKGAMSYYNGRS